MRRRNERLEAELARTEGGVGDHGKSTRALGAALRERGHRPEVEAGDRRRRSTSLRHWSRPSRRARCSACHARACYRRRRPRLRAPTSRPRPARRTRSPEPSASSCLDVLHEPRYCDLAPAQVWARLLDDGIYLSSISTMYRLLRAHGENRERRRQRTHPATGQAGADRPPTRTTCGRGISPSCTARARRLLRPVRDHRHLQPLRPRVAGRPWRDRRARRGVHRRHHRRRRRRPRQCSTPTGAPR